VILTSRVTEQIIDRNERATFVKEVIVTRGIVPLAMVRKRLAENAGGTRAPVLLIHGFGQNRYAWHLPSRSLANHLAQKGFDVFNLDLRGHGRSRHFGGKRCTSVSDYFLEDLPAALDEVLSLSGHRPAFIVGHSLGGLVAYAGAPRLAGAVAGIASVGSPYHFTRGSLSLQAVSAFMRGFALLHGSANPSMPLKPVGLTLASFRRIAESRLYLVPWRGWHKGAMEPHILAEHMRLAFDRAGLAELSDMFKWASEKKFGGKEADHCERFEHMDLPLLIVAGTNDDLAPPDSVRPAFTQSRSRDKTYRALPLGHIDLLVGREAPRIAWPLISDWIRARAA